MMPFGAQYSSIYDSIYAAKDYAAECDFLETVLAKYAVPLPTKVLDVGCGTGGHAIVLGERGHEVVGVDVSQEMLAVAAEKAGKRTVSLELIHADMRQLHLHRKFGAVVSMFAVISYLPTNQDVLLALRSMREHLEEGGIAIFDAWFGPGVLVDPPADRERTIRDGSAKIVRLAHPELDLEAQSVAVEYRIQRYEGGRLTKESREVHRMRFFFPQETALLLEAAGFVLLEMCPFMLPGVKLRSGDWNFNVIARAR